MEKNITKLSNELAYQTYIMNRDQIWKHLSSLSMREYIVLNRISDLGQTSEIYPGKIYLKELAENMRLTIRQTSKMASNLRDRGLITWSHDGNGNEGTYLSLTDSGQKLMEENQKMIKDYFGRVIEKFGNENLVELLQLMKQLDAIMHGELGETMEETKDDNESE